MKRYVYFYETDHCCTPTIRKTVTFHLKEVSLLAAKAALTGQNKDKELQGHSLDSFGSCGLCGQVFMDLSCLPQMPLDPVGPVSWGFSWQLNSSDFLLWSLSLSSCPLLSNSNITVAIWEEGGVLLLYEGLDEKFLWTTLNKMSIISLFLFIISNKFTFT